MSLDTPRPSRTAHLREGEALAGGSSSSASSSPAAALASPSTPTARVLDDLDDDVGDVSLESTSTAAASARSRRAAIELSLPTRRRLIRKPLPELPGLLAPGAEEQEQLLGAPVRSASPPGLRALAWLPEQLPESEPPPDEPGDAQLGAGLDAQSMVHLRQILAHLAPDEGGAGSTTTAHTQELSAALLDAVAAACKSLSAPDTLSALQRTAAMRWRAEESLRAASLGAAPAPSSSRWPRLPWAALGGASPSVMTAASYMEPRYDEDIVAPGPRAPGPEGEARVRKRDVAVRMLANAAWLVRSYSPLPTVPPVEQSSEQSGVASTGMEDAAKEVAKPSKSKGAAPALLMRGPTATTALNTGGDGSAPPSPPKKTPSPRPGPSPLPHSTGSSRAMASLSAAAGASLAAAVRAESQSSTSSRTTSRAGSRRPSVTSLASHASSARPVSFDAAARAETEALERANREWLERVGTQCSAAARVCVARVCLLAHVGSGERTMRGRGAAPEDKNATGPPPLAEWKEGVFDGPELLGDGPANRGGQGASDQTRVRRVGGTFVLYLKDEEEAKWARESLEILLYSGTSMLLEAALLASVGAPRPQPAPEPLVTRPRTSSLAHDLRSREPSDASTADSDMTVTDELRSPRRWGAGFWGVGQAVSAALRGQGESRHAHKNSASGMLERVPTAEATPVPGTRRSSIGFPRSRTREDSASGSASGSAAGSRASRHSRTGTPHESSYAVARFGRLFTSSLSRGTSAANGDAESAARWPSLKEDDKDEQDETPDAARRRAPSLPEKVMPAPPTPVTPTPLRLGPAPLTTSPELAALWKGDADKSLTGTAYAQAFRAAQHLPFLVEGSTLVGFAKHYDVASGTAGSVPSAPSSSSHVGPTGCSADQSLAREEVRYYAREGQARDVPLGQLIEEMCARVKQQESERATRTAQPRLSSSSEAPSSVAPQRHAIHYTHGQQRVSVIAQLLPPELLLEDGENESAAVQAATEEKEDVAAIVAALHMEADSARAAVAAADTAVSAIEGGAKAATGQLTSQRHGLWMWTVDARSGEHTKARLMPQATYLMSFARYLEALLYHPALQSGVPAAQAAVLRQRQAEQRHDLVRAFRMGRAFVKISTQPLTVYQLAIEGPSIFCQKNDKAPRNARGTASLRTGGSRASPLLSKTRLEIQNFFTTVKAQITSLEHLFVARELDDKGRTIKPPKSLSKASDTDFLSDATTPTLDSSSWGSASMEPLSLLNKLRISLTSHEFDLYDSLKETDADAVNDVRKAFNDRAKSAKNRLNAWSRKHLTKAELLTLGPLEFEEPEYFGRGFHTFPGSRHVVREDEPLSIIAFSLSSRDYKHEVGGHTAKAEHEQRVLNWRTSVIPGASGSQLSSSSGAPSLALSEQSQRSAASGQLDPDFDEIFHDAQPVRVAMKRKRRGREQSILSLTLRRVGSTISATSETPPHAAQSEGAAPPASHSSDSSAADTVLDDGRSVEPGEPGNTQSCLSSLSPRSLDDNNSEATPPASRIVPGKNYRFDGSISSAGTNSTFRAQVVQVSGQPPSLASLFSRDMNGDSSVDAASLAESSAASASLDTLWDRSDGFNSVREPKAEAVADHGQRIASEGAAALAPPPLASGLPLSSSSAATGSLGDGVLGSGAVARPSAPAIAEHIKHNIFHGATKVSCVSWFAQDFATLRQRWGIEDDDYAESLSRCAMWTASGGKSKSAFFKTHDDRFVAKQLLTVWSVDEKEAFLEFAPAYLRYMMNAAVNDCPTLLVKIAGVYSLKIKQVGGDTRLKMNIMLLENLWTGKETARFDLKGIRDRRTKPGGAVAEETGSPVLWDAEWLDMFHAPHVPEAQKELFQRAIANDLHFLQQTQIMDYSLLLGVTEPSAADADKPGSGAEQVAPRIQVRIVDIIGAWTLAKSLESSGKRVLKSNKDNVTILPPRDYAARFSASMNSYFTGTPQRAAADAASQPPAAAAGAAAQPEVLPSVF